MNLDSVITELRQVHSEYSRDDRGKPIELRDVKAFHYFYQVAMRFVANAMRLAGEKVTDRDFEDESSQLVKNTQLAFREVLGLGPMVDPEATFLVNTAETVPFKKETIQ